MPLLLSVGRAFPHPPEILTEFPEAKGSQRKGPRRPTLAGLAACQCHFASRGLSVRDIGSAVSPDLRLIELSPTSTSVQISVFVSYEVPVHE